MRKGNQLGDPSLPPLPFSSHLSPLLPSPPFPSLPSSPPFRWVYSEGRVRKESEPSKEHLDHREFRFFKQAYAGLEPRLALNSSVA